MLRRAAAKLDSEGKSLGHQLDVFGDKHPEVSSCLSASHCCCNKHGTHTAKRLQARIPLRSRLR